MAKVRTATTSVTANLSAWTLMFCVTLLERLYNRDRDSTLKAIAAYFGWQLTK